MNLRWKSKSSTVYLLCLTGVRSHNSIKADLVVLPSERRKLRNPGLLRQPANLIKRLSVSLFGKVCLHCNLANLLSDRSPWRSMHSFQCARWRGASESWYSSTLVLKNLDTQKHLQRTCSNTNKLLQPAAVLFGASLEVGTVFLEHTRLASASLK